jgi:hypothetical protein
MQQSYWTRILQRRMSRRRAASLTGAAAAVAVLAACRSSQGKSPDTSRSATAPPAAKAMTEVPDSTLPVRSESVDPKDTDPEIDTALQSHYVAFSTVPVRGRLFLFLPGTLIIPDQHQLISDQAARNGFHSVNLRYPNSDAVQNLCGLDKDTTCFENTRLEIIDGTDRTPKVHVNRANSIENRLLKLLSYLKAKHPDEGWEAFIDGKEPKWSSIVVAGHSQGGGHVALIARDHLVARASMLSGPVDHLGPNQRLESAHPAPWLLGAHMTPSERYFAFGHIHDELVDWEPQWKALGLGMTNFGPTANVDKATPPFGGSHLLTTAAQPRNGPAPNLNHSSTAIDRFTPLTQAGQALFAPVWQYVCFA